ncbi:hypothetical protein PPACK8108_LOCUS24772 [Phakopsora pachyrhizi]|uniref:Uncharacterized protein n=1 Tax=Phakopsora pachyrhizi TaxID=170000 RepID=A0AAV0BSA3_PHAPC|nr:hypothetical protein PPACK8108_LOCUS24772 [Phakopsora pachyrhizi]
MKEIRSVFKVLTFSSILIGLVISATINQNDRLEDLTRRYTDELKYENGLIEGMELYLEMEEEDSDESDIGMKKISDRAKSFLESQYDLLRPRQELVELIPTDSVVNTEALEYIAAVGSRHSAREFKKYPVLESIKTLKVKNARAQIFDNILLSLAKQSVREEREMLEDLEQEDKSYDRENFRGKILSKEKEGPNVPSKLSGQQHKPITSKTTVSLTYCSHERKVSEE